ncbi:hypothetical protein EMIHUDRAFT_102025 [Emiliania huxleyi CCMP1516]|uniref:Hexosyltransferase n=2 Tax=Emiliania huxleyi TaxID=2903 RepID=A0A0D3J927_EMIH1|nr:hypothetical protein EMIHUDRAFT_102025 [Emiliania huxleyi CCMP1516]EOD20012.1 hypothetical protein EMIHUDRAFT_102025 [Emiliania huxleyi CCMP1516]|eukprot:XP_005772441.1 hypothetical protein EMIHUDRAFT_102025 [Emiliania huxleyi CCMP1516]
MSAAAAAAAAAVSVRPPAGFAVIGIIGPDNAKLRSSLRGWTEAVSPAVLARFAISLRDRASAQWPAQVTAAEPDIDFLDCLGQRSGAGVVIISLFDAWLRHAVARYPHATFVGRADSDAVPSPSWLLAMLAAESERQAQHGGVGEQHVYAGSMQWYHWDELAFRPWGWGMGPHGAHRRAVHENPKHCTAEPSPRCAGPFPFAAGPLLMLSKPLARWYTRSAAVAKAVSAALDSRLNRTRGHGDDTDGGKDLSLAEARARGHFLPLSEPGDLDVRIFDDVFLGHAFCVGDGGGVGGHSAGGVGGVSNLTILALPPGLIEDFPCGGGKSGCQSGLRRFNWTVSGAPLIAHHIRKPEYVPQALAQLRRAPFAIPHAAECRPFSPAHTPAPRPYCLREGRSWQWCTLPFKPAPPMKQPPRKPLKPKPKGTAKPTFWDIFRGLC